MSGPKVVRIVTREELIAISERILARVDEAIRQWTRIGIRNGVIDSREIAEIKKRSDDFHTMLRKGRFDMVQNSGPAFANWLSKDMDKRLEAKVAAEAKAVENRRRLTHAAALVLEKVRDRGGDLPKDVQRTLEHAAVGNDRGPAIEAALLKAIALISSADEASLTPKQKELADRLGADEPSLMFTEWLERNSTQLKSNDQLRRIDRHIAELSAIAGSDQGHKFVERLERAQFEQNEARRRLLIDSLLIEVADATQAAKDLHLRRSNLGLACAELSAENNAEHATLLAEVEALPESASFQTIDSCIERIRRALDATLTAKIAAGRREAVLKGLAQLGYEVKEGMATAWATDGRLVLRKPAIPGYGIEIGGRAEVGRVQMRAVAFDNVARDITRDADVENLWCGDVAALDRELRALGGAVFVDRALAAGQTPMKVVATADTHIGQADPAAKGSRERFH